MAIEEILLGFIAGAVGSLVLWVTLGRHLMLKYAGKSVINALSDPSEETKSAVYSLFALFWESANEQVIPVGKNEQGGTIKISAIQAVVNEAAEHVVARVRGVVGSVKKGEYELANQLSAGLGIPMPRKGQNTQEFLLEQLGSRLMPVIEDKLKKMLDQSVQQGTGLIKRGL